MLTALAVFAAMAGVRAYVVKPFVVRGDSMAAALADGDRILVDRITYLTRAPRRGEVVVIVGRIDADDAIRELVKRVVALPGEAVEVRGCLVVVDGQPLPEPYLDPEVLQRDGCGAPQRTIRVPEGTVYVLGDHRGRSNDSRYFGPVAEERIVGRVFLRIWPPGSLSVIGARSAQAEPSTTLPGGSQR